MFLTATTIDNQVLLGVFIFDPFYFFKISLPNAINSKQI